MNIKSAGTYIAVSDKIAMLIKVTGMYPNFKIVSGVLLNDFIRYGTTVTLKENSLELQLINDKPNLFVFMTLDILDNAQLPGLDYITKGKIEFDEDLYKRWERKLLDIRNIPGMHINSLLVDIMQMGNCSLPQARCVLYELRKRLFNES